MGQEDRYEGPGALWPLVLPSKAHILNNAGERTMEKGHAKRKYAF